MAFLDVPSPFECVCLCVSVCVSIYMCVCVCECPCVCKYRTPPPPPPTPPPHLINVFLTRTVIPRCRLECVKLRWAPTYFHHDIGDLSGFVCQNLCVPCHLRSPEGGGVSQFGGKRKWPIFARRKTENFDFLKRKSEIRECSGSGNQANCNAEIGNKHLKRKRNWLDSMAEIYFF